MSEAVNTCPKIYEAISNVMQSIGAVGKSQKNKTQGYMFRGIDDVMNAVQPAFVNNKVFVVPNVLNEEREEKVTKSGSVLFYARLKVSYRFYTVDGSFVEANVIGEAMDSGDKATNKAMSAAYKYACFQVLSIPTEEMRDTETEDPESIKPSTKKSNDIEPSREEQERKKKEIEEQKIGEVEKNALLSKAAERGVSIESICERYNAKSVEELTNLNFYKAMNALEKTPKMKKETNLDL